MLRTLAVMCLVLAATPSLAEVTLTCKVTKTTIRIVATNPDTYPYACEVTCKAGGGIAGMMWPTFKNDVYVPASVANAELGKAEFAGKHLEGVANFDYSCTTVAP